MIKKILVAAAFGAAAVGAQASSNLVLNGGFDGTTSSYVYNAAPTSVATYYGSVPTQARTVDDWTGSFVSIASNSGDWGNPSGLANFDASTSGGYVAGVQADGVLSQALTLDAGTYLLTWSDANRSGTGSNESYSVSFDGVTYTTVATQAGAGWESEAVVFTLGAAATGELSFTGLTSYQNTDATSFIDNVSVSAVPEPASLLLMAVGTLGLLAWRRRAQI
jgi:hypothetical protein